VTAFGDPPNFVVHTPAQIDDHDRLSGYRARTNWPAWLHVNTLNIHMHYCELVQAWNLNPFRRQESFSVVTVDESAEAEGISRFVFCSVESLNDFIDGNELEHLIEKLHEPGPSGAYYWATLRNNFGRDEMQAFMDDYRRSMVELATIQNERMGAIRHDGGKVGYITADHFTSREMYELNRIKAARQKLGAGINGQ
jgi:hypothetical protein